MRRFIKMMLMNGMLMDEANTDGGTGGSGYTEPKPESKEPTPESTPTDKSPEEAGSDTDDYGYGKVEPEAKEESKEKEVEKTEPKKEEPEKEVEAITGYDKEQKVPEKKPEAEPKVEDKEKSTDDPKEVVLSDTGDLLETEITEIKDFVKKHGINQEQAQALVEREKERIKNLNASVKTQEDAAADAKVVKHKEWIDELKADTTFGGENFAHNVKQVDKVIDQFFPNMKKALTEVDVLLPPYVMRDLSGLAKHLFKTEKLVQGEAGKEDESDDNKEYDHLDYYS